MTPILRITDLSSAQQRAVVLLVNRLASLNLPDDFVETLLQRAADDAEQLMRYMLDEGFARAIDQWFNKNLDDMFDETT